MAKIIITSDRETIDLDPAGNIVRKRVIQFMIDDKGPYTYEVPKDLFSIEAFKAYAREIADQIREIEAAEV